MNNSPLTAPLSPHLPLKQYFERLNLEPDIAEIYLVLHAYGPQNILQLSRSSGIERTRLYRLLDTLEASHLITRTSEYKKVIISAAPITNLQILLSKREQELRDLQSDLQELQHLLGSKSIESPVTKVQMYRGIDGLKQMFWNQTKAKSESVAIMYENMQNRTNLAFFERWVRRCNEQDLTFRGIIGEHFVKTQQEWYGTHTNERLANWSSRYAPPEIFPITHSSVTYDNIVSYYNWKDGEVFGVEIHNQEIANAQRSLFELLWQQSIEVDDLKGLEK
jgi:sugar-specific transcriptional regulator TrmB